MKSEKPKLDINLKDQSEPVTCEKCTSLVFVEGIMLRRVNKLLIGADQDGMIPIPVFSCQMCGHINSNMMPKL